MAFKLTVAREQQPALLTHSILHMLIVIFLGKQYGLDNKELIDLATAALFHDLGILHINPALLREDHVLKTEERRHLYTHPMVAYLILVEFPEYPPSIYHAVLEHHERLDGSGYPRGIKGNQISLFGMLLAVAEIAASRCDKDGFCNNFHRLEIILKLNTHKLPRDLIALLAPFYKTSFNGSKSSVKDLPRNLPTVPYSLAELFTDWLRITEPQDRFVIQQDYQPLFDFISQQLSSLLKELRDAGFDPHNLNQLMQDADSDSVYLDDIISLTHEIHWQIQDQIHEAGRRWPELLDQETTGQATKLVNWINKARSLSEVNELLLDTDFESDVETIVEDAKSNDKLE